MALYIKTDHSVTRSFILVHQSVFDISKVRMSSNCSLLKSFPWIDLQFVENIISKAESESNTWEIESYHGGNFENNGQNFSSHMIRLIVNLRDRDNRSKVLSKAFFVKIRLNTEDFENVLKESLLFEKEIEVYSKILPAVEELLKSIGMPTQIGPK